MSLITGRPRRWKVRKELRRAMKSDPLPPELARGDLYIYLPATYEPVVVPAIGRWEVLDETGAVRKVLERSGSAGNVAAALARLRGSAVVRDRNGVEPDVLFKLVDDPERGRYVRRFA